MFGRTSCRRCAAPATLSRWLVQLADQVDNLATVSSSPSSSSVDPQVTKLWRDIEQISVQAFALRETDTLTGIVQGLFQRRLYPSDRQIWPVLAERLLSFSDVESRSVLQYPGTPDAVLRVTSQQPNALTPVSREMLLLTGGVVPLSARGSCASGDALADFLRSFVSAWEAEDAHEASLETGRDILFRMCGSVLQVLQRNAATLQFDALHDAIDGFFTLLLRSDLQQAASARSLASVPSHSASFGVAIDAGMRPDTSLPLCRLFLWQMQVILQVPTVASSSSSPSPGGSPTAALGPRLALAWLGPMLSSHTASPVADGSTSETQTATVRVRFYQELLRMIDEASILMYCQLSDLVQIPHTWQLSALIADLQQEIEVVYQRNTNQGNTLAITEAAQSDLVLTVALTRLRVMRLEHHAADAFLRDAVPIVERLPASMMVEAELLLAKVALLDLLDLEEEGRDAVYDDLVRSLRHVVQLRPRTTLRNGDDGADSDMSASPEQEAFGDSSSLGSGAGEYDFERRASGGAAGGSGSVGGLESTAQSALQRAHVAVLTALCGAHQQYRVDQAYELVVAHKYHGLVVNTDVIVPLLKVMSQRGDCRVFNLVDLCVLYCQSPVNMDAITYLFEACAVAGDHYRARTLYQLLQEVIPGFAVKASPSIKESLRELKILSPPPMHAFLTEEQRVAKLATLGQHADGLEPSRLPDPPGTEN